MQGYGEEPYRGWIEYSTFGGMPYLTYIQTT